MRNATYLALAAAAISGVSNFTAKIAVSVISDATLFTTLKNSLVALFLIGCVVALKKMPEIKSLTKSQWLKLAAIGLIGGSVPFALFFTGLQKTSAINAGLIHKTLFLWVLLMAIPILKEKLSWQQWAGIGAIFGANLAIGGFTGFKLNSGELMILLATIFWAIENIIAKIALKDISSITVASARMVFGSFLLFLFLVWKDTPATSIFNLNPEQWGWTIFSSILLFGYVTTWYAALKYAPATYVAALLVPATLITNILSAVFITHSFSVAQISSSLLFIIGSALIIAFAKKTVNFAGAAKNYPVAETA